jgi:hypothetical protein
LPTRGKCVEERKNELKTSYGRKKIEKKSMTRKKNRTKIQKQSEMRKKYKISTNRKKKGKIGKKYRHRILARVGEWRP